MGFDRKICTRCGGSGQYSYNQINGTTCFGCGGSGKMLTPRGKRQAEAFRQSLVRPAAEVQVGEYIKLWPSPKWRKVTKIEQLDSGIALWTNEHIHNRLICDEGYKLESFKSEAHRKSLIAEACKVE